MIAALALALQGLPAAELPPPPESTCDQPVLMVVTGTTHDRERMLAYAQAIAASKLYEKLGGYYVNIPAPLANFEGEAEDGHVTLIVRFPCLENARAFWCSRTYQEEIRPLRLDPSAGDYIVRVYPEAPLREDLVGKVGDNGYLAEFYGAAIEQVED
ncbi:DUF1330 domain-containing protein [Altererythrobacter arenosus]|uniref:DUF1330 domain-containing protein n=1 Tax=Altererythrobacter arenosus TaxID=3032592 RepID=A0ABY8FMX6_9SPHN|nr:DUF1330 domain-containing protein [Altererythrobacter sp. CAU 1644]WFL76358.1 DUF1330 domain-containing protein [Altererythrobacter sp. CAU 1644]